MIPGDIDLTEKLDFRKVVRKEIPQLPATWNGKNSLSNFQTNSINITSTVRTTMTYQIFDQNIQYWYDDHWNTINYDDDFDSITTFTTSPSQRTNSYALRDNWITWNDDDYNLVINYSSSTSSSRTYKTTISYGKPEHDVFGNVKIHEEKIPDIPWDLTKRRNKVSINSIPWKNKYEDVWNSFRDDDEYIPKIPWHFNKSRRPDKEVDLTSVVSRARNLISWLSDKSTRVIENYLSSDEEVDLSYLTRMGWIGVRDAVIE
jgi:hypothetical protein